MQFFFSCEFHLRSSWYQSSVFCWFKPSWWIHLRSSHQDRKASAIKHGCQESWCYYAWCCQGLRVFLFSIIVLRFQYCFLPSFFCFPWNLIFFMCFYAITISDLYHCLIKCFSSPTRMKLLVLQFLLDVNENTLSIVFEFKTIIWKYKQPGDLATDTMSCWDPLISTNEMKTFRVFPFSFGYWQFMMNWCVFPRQIQYHEIYSTSVYHIASNKNYNLNLYHTRSKHIHIPTRWCSAQHHCLWRWKIGFDSSLGHAKNLLKMVLTAALLSSGIVD